MRYPDDEFEFPSGSLHMQRHLGKGGIHFNACSGYSKNLIREKMRSPAGLKRAPSLAGQNRRYIQRDLDQLHLEGSHRFSQYSDLLSFVA